MGGGIPEMEVESVMSGWRHEWTVRAFAPDGRETYRMTTGDGERASLTYDVKASRLTPGEAVEIAKDGEPFGRREKR